MKKLFPALTGKRKEKKKFFLRLTEKEPKNETGRELLPLQAYPFTFSLADKMLNTFDNGSSPCFLMTDHVSRVLTNLLTYAIMGQRLKANALLYVKLSALIIMFRDLDKREYLVIIMDIFVSSAHNHML